MFSYFQAPVIRAQGSCISLVNILASSAPIQKEEHLDAEVFSKMKKMRLLKVVDMGNVKLPQGLNCLSNELHIIE